MGVTVKLKDVRGSFLVLAEPEYFGGTKSKADDQRRWSATGLVPFADKQTINLIMDALRFVAKEEWKDKADTMLANILPDPKGCCWVDGNRKAYDGYKDCWALTAHRPENKGRPLVYDNDKTPIYKANNELYEGKAGRLFSGCYVNMSVEIWAQNNKAGKGLRATLLGIQRVRIGEAFGGGRPPDPNDFDELAGDEEESLS